MTVLRPAQLPPVGHMTTAVRLRLALEFLAAYLPLVRLVRTNDLRAMVATARTPVLPRIVTVPADAHPTAVRLGKVVQRLFELLPMDGRCLIRSLVLLRLLEQRSISATFSIGVKSDGDFGAHAWVEHDAVPVLPTGRMARLVDL